MSLKPRGRIFSVSSEHDESYNIHTIHAYLICFHFFTIWAHIWLFSLRFIMPTQEDDWSDSDQEELSDVETLVLIFRCDIKLNLRASRAGLHIKSMSYQNQRGYGGLRCDSWARSWRFSWTMRAHLHLRRPNTCDAADAFGPLRNTIGWGR